MNKLLSLAVLFISMPNTLKPMAPEVRGVDEGRRAVLQKILGGDIHRRVLVCRIGSLDFQFISFNEDQMRTRDRLERTGVRLFMLGMTGDRLSHIPDQARILSTRNDNIHHNDAKVCWACRLLVDANLASITPERDSILKYLAEEKTTFEYRQTMTSGSGRFAHEHVAFLTPSQFPSVEFTPEQHDAYNKIISEDYNKNRSAEKFKIAERFLQTVEQTAQLPVSSFTITGAGETYEAICPDNVV